MKIYGVALLAACYLVGQLLGAWLGVALGIGGNVGGVGFGMLLLILLGTRMRRMGYLGDPAEQGVLFWSAMYIPIVIAMAATQNVKAALSGGWVAVVVGIGATGISFLLVPLIARIGTARPEKTEE